MEKIEFIPKACIDVEGQPAKLKGFVVLSTPGFDERYELLDEVGLKIDPVTGEVDAASLASIKTIRKMVTASKKYYLEVRLEKMNGEKVTSFEQMAMDPEFDAVLIEIGMNISKGFRPAKD